MTRKPKSDSSGISFTALYTGAVWHRQGLSDDLLATEQGRWLYHLMTPFESLSRAVAGGNIRTFLTQRHLIIDHLIESAITDGKTQILEIACGLSPRGLRLRKAWPELHMVEADLPDMASKKAGRLAVSGHLGPNHQVVPIDILASSGEQSLEAVIERAFPNRDPVIVVTEGLTSYFSLETMTTFWTRLGTSLKQRPGSVYLSESYRMPSQPWLRHSLNMLGKGLGAVTRSDVSFHFETDEETQQHFQACGFSDTRVWNPVAFYGALPIPKSRHDPMVRIIEAGF